MKGRPVSKMPSVNQVGRPSGLCPFFTIDSVAVISVIDHPSVCPGLSAEEFAKVDGFRAIRFRCSCYRTWGYRIFNDGWICIPFTEGAVDLLENSANMYHTIAELVIDEIPRLWTSRYGGAEKTIELVGRVPTLLEAITPEAQFPELLRSDPR